MKKINPLQTYQPLDDVDIPEQKKVELPSFDSLLESSRKYNHFKQQTKESLISNSRINFNEAHEDYSKHIREFSHTPPTDTSEKDIKVSMIKAVCAAVMDLIHSDKFNEKDTLQYLDVLEGKVPFRLLALQFWAQDKKEAVFLIFKGHQISMNEKEYESLAEQLDVYQHNNNIPLGGNLKKEYIENQKQEFLYYQKRYALLEELNNMPTKDVTAKKVKL